MFNLTNNSNKSEIKHQGLTTFARLTTYIPLVIIFLALFGNTTSLLIFRLNKEMKEMPSMVILSFVCVTDTLSLFTWNLNHYLSFNHDVFIDNINIYFCKIFQFLQFSSLQCSGLLLTLISVDRYFSIRPKTNSFVGKLPFGTIKSATIWSFSITFCISLLNSFILIYDRYDIHNDTRYKFINYKLSNGFDLMIWERVHYSIYCVIPFIIMTIFNFLLIKTTFDSSRKYRNNHNKFKNLTYSLVFISISYLVMTLPSALYFSLIFDSNLNYDPNKLSYIYLLDHFLFLNHSTLFFNCLITNLKFRKIVFSFFKKS
jgi:hypothetical protein